MKDCLIGANYFCGWWRDVPNKWMTDGADWRLGYPGRIPLAGSYNDAAAIDAEIAAAASYGVDFFLILWYSDEAGEPAVAHLNSGMELFMRSPLAGRMRFAAEYCNHPPFLIAEDAVWRKKADYFAECMAHPSYLRVGGRPVFKIHGLHYFREECGRNEARMRARLDYLAGRAVREAGAAPLVCAGVMAGGMTEEERRAAKLFHFTATYGDVPALPARRRDYPYRLLAAQGERARDIFGGERGHIHMPYLMTGWNPRPWRDPRPSFRAPTDAEWEQSLAGMKRDLARYPNLGIPCGEGIQPAFTVYAWNEYGEGGILAPTLGEGYRRLEKLKKVFGRGEEENPKGEEPAAQAAAESS